ncbi:MAG: DUF4870 domain-containing protein [Phycisphaerales bacterium]
MNEHTDQPETTSPPPPIAPDAGIPGELASSEERTMAMLCHILAIFFGFLAPLIIWLIKKNESKFVDYHGKESLNFQITLFIGYLICGALIFVLIGCFLLPALAIAAIVFAIIAGIATNKGEYYRYPFAMRLIK